MMMRIEVLSEDRSGGAMIEKIIPKMLSFDTRQIDFAVRPHRGLGEWPDNNTSHPKKNATGLLELLPAKLRAYDKVYASTRTLVIVIMDTDKNDPDEIRSRIKDMCRKNGPNLKTVIGLCTEETEAWLMGDVDAIKQAYPDADMQVMDEYVQDSICGTWEVLCRVLLKEKAGRAIRIGYPAIGQLKSEWSGRISKYMDPAKNKSPSYNRFKKDFEKAVNFIMEQR